MTTQTPSDDSPLPEPGASGALRIPSTHNPWIAALAGIVLLYFFILGINLIGGGFKFFGKGHAKDSHKRT